MKPRTILAREVAADLEDNAAIAIDELRAARGTSAYAAITRAILSDCLADGVIDRHEQGVLRHRTIVLGYLAEQQVHSTERDLQHLCGLRAKVGRSAKGRAASHAALSLHEQRVSQEA